MSDTTNATGPQRALQALYEPEHPHSCACIQTNHPQNYYLLFTPGAEVAVQTYFIALTTYYLHHTYIYYFLLTVYSR